MTFTIHNKRRCFSSRAISALVLVVFGFSVVLPPSVSCAENQSSTSLNLPAPGTFVSLSKGYIPTHLKGITIYPNDPLRFNFIVDTGDSGAEGQALKDESTKLIKYFLASLTVPEEELWVNLSPYEKDRIIPESFGVTEMGRDLLSQDYLLKQLTVSLMSPEETLGKSFWEKIYKKAQAEMKGMDIPLETFHKIWIVPDKAVIYEHDNSAFIVESHLKVMLEEDYLAISDQASDVRNQDLTAVIRQTILPEIEHEVNNGKNFANLRQIFNAMILATWYKNNLKESLLGQIYVDRNKIKGVDVDDKEIKQKIYDQYIEAFQKGVYNYIKEEYDATNQEIIPRKYFSGGCGAGELGKVIAEDKIEGDFSMLPPFKREKIERTLAPSAPEARIFSEPTNLLDVGGDAVEGEVEKVREATSQEIALVIGGASDAFARVIKLADRLERRAQENSSDDEAMVEAPVMSPLSMRRVGEAFLKYLEDQKILNFGSREDYAFEFFRFLEEFYELGYLRRDDLNRLITTEDIVTLRVSNNRLWPMISPQYSEIIEAQRGSLFSQENWEKANEIQRYIYHELRVQQNPDLIVEIAEGSEVDKKDLDQLWKMIFDRIEVTSNYQETVLRYFFEVIPYDAAGPNAYTVALKDLGDILFDPDEDRITSRYEYDERYRYLTDYLEHAFSPSLSGILAANVLMAIDDNVTRIHPKFQSFLKQKEVALRYVDFFALYSQIFEEKNENPENFSFLDFEAKLHQKIGFGLQRIAQALTSSKENKTIDHEILKKVQLMGKASQAYSTHKDVEARMSQEALASLREILQLAKELNASRDMEEHEATEELLPFYITISIARLNVEQDYRYFIEFLDWVKDLEGDTKVLNFRNTVLQSRYWMPYYYMAMAIDEHKTAEYAILKENSDYEDNYFDFAIEKLGSNFHLERLLLQYDPEGEFSDAPDVVLKKIRERSYNLAHEYIERLIQSGNYDKARQVASNLSIVYKAEENRFSGQMMLALHKLSQRISAFEVVYNTFTGSEAFNSADEEKSQILPYLKKYLTTADITQVVLNLLRGIEVVVKTEAEGLLSDEMIVEEVTKIVNTAFRGHKDDRLLAFLKNTDTALAQRLTTEDEIRRWIISRLTDNISGYVKLRERTNAETALEAYPRQVPELVGISSGPTLDEAMAGDTRGPIWGQSEEKTVSLVELLDDMTRKGSKLDDETRANILKDLKVLREGMREKVGIARGTSLRSVEFFNSLSSPDTSSYLFLFQRSEFSKPFVALFANNILATVLYNEANKPRRGPTKVYQMLEYVEAYVAEYVRQQGALKVRVLEGKALVDHLLMIFQSETIHLGDGRFLTLLPEIETYDAGGMDGFTVGVKLKNGDFVSPTPFMSFSVAGNQLQSPQFSLNNVSLSLEESAVDLTGKGIETQVHQKIFQDIPLGVELVENLGKKGKATFSDTAPKEIPIAKKAERDRSQKSDDDSMTPGEHKKRIVYSLSSLEKTEMGYNLKVDGHDIIFKMPPLESFVEQQRAIALDDIFDVFEVDGFDVKKIESDGFKRFLARLLNMLVGFRTQVAQKNIDVEVEYGQNETRIFVRPDTVAEQTITISHKDGSIDYTENISSDFDGQYQQILHLSSRDLAFSPAILDPTLRDLAIEVFDEAAEMINDGHKTIGRVVEFLKFMAGPRSEEENQTLLSKWQGQDQSTAQKIADDLKAAGIDIGDLNDYLSGKLKGYSAQAIRIRGILDAQDIPLTLEEITQNPRAQRIVSKAGHLLAGPEADIAKSKVIFIPRNRWAGEDSMATGADRVGGINLNPALLDMQIKRDGKGVALPVSEQPILEMDIDGFLPIIIDIIPVSNLHILLGIAEESEPDRVI